MTIIRTKAQAAVVGVQQETLRRVRADALIRETCWRMGSKLYLAGTEFDLATFRRILVLGAGKAGPAMAQGILGLLAGYPVSGLVVTKYGHSLPVDHIEVIEAGHPVPDQASLEAGRRMLDLAATASLDDLVIVLITGGASSLIEDLVPGVELHDLQLLTDSLLKSGAEIQELNKVRSCLSEIKAGGLARACGDAQIVCLLLSDVLGNAREAIGSGPCWGAPPQGSEALAILKARRIPIQESISNALENGRNLVSVHPEHIVIGDVFTLLEAAQKAAESLGLRAKVYNRTFTGEAREVGARMAAEALSLQGDSGKIDCIVAAGESTVTVKGQGLGGRNQELACAAALALQDIPDIALLAFGTDGTDGPTDAAGGLIDGTTHLRADLRHALDQNDSYHALENADALFITGPTQTNLNDLVVIARVSEP